MLSWWIIHHNSHFIKYPPGSDSHCETVSSFHTLSDVHWELQAGAAMLPLRRSRSAEFQTTKATKLEALRATSFSNLVNSI